MKIEKPISIVMLAYNEKNHIERVLREYHDTVFTQCPQGSEFIVYLDGPTDGTDGLVKGLSEELGLKVVEGEGNLGYFKAAKAALSKSKNDIVFFSDSSGKHIAKDFFDLLPHIEDADIVNGKRKDRGDVFYRRMLSAVHTLFVSILFYIYPMDYNTGFKIYHRRVLDDVLPKVCTLPVAFSTEMIILSQKRGYKIVEVPVSFIKREGAEKQLSISKIPGLIIKNLIPYLSLRIRTLKTGD